MKKLHIGLLMISGEWGGAEEAMYQLAKHLAELHVIVSVFINNELKEHYSDINDISIYTLGSFNNKNVYRFLCGLYKIRHNLIEALKIHPVDIIHTQLHGSLFAYIGLFSKFRIPVIFTLQGSELRASSGRKNLYQIAIYFLLNEMLKKSTQITSPSSWQIKSLKSEYRLKTILIPHGVDTKEFYPIKMKKGRNVILHVGRFVGWKGIVELTEAAKELPQYEFWFAGWGPLADCITLPNTKKLGFKKRDELLELYNKATICVFPSYFEPFGIVGLEAMACGTPIIATEKGFSEFLQNNIEGIIIEPKNKEQLKSAIVMLMENTQLREMFGKNAREKSLKYDWIEIVNKYHVLYENVVAR